MYVILLLLLKHLKVNKTIWRLLNVINKSPTGLLLIGIVPWLAFPIDWKFKLMLGMILMTMLISINVNISMMISINMNNA